MIQVFDQSDLYTSLKNCATLSNEARPFPYQIKPEKARCSITKSLRLLTEKTVLKSLGLLSGNIRVSYVLWKS